MQSRFVELEEQTDITQTVSHYGARIADELLNPAWSAVSQYTRQYASQMKDLAEAVNATAADENTNSSETMQWQTVVVMPPPGIKLVIFGILILILREMVVWVSIRSLLRRKGRNNTRLHSRKDI